MALFEWELIERVPVAGPAASGRKRWRGNPSVEQLHDGTLLVTYREGSDHWFTPDGIVRLCRSTDNGKTWSGPETIVALEDRDISPLFKMRELPDGSLLLPILESHHMSGSPTYFRYYNRALKSVHLSFSRDQGHTWSQPAQLDFGPQYIFLYCYGDILINREGEIVLCLAWQCEGDTVWRTGLARSRDGGQTWGDLTELANGFDDEKSICRLPTGRLVAVLRNFLKPSQIAFSDDDGRTWSKTRSLPFVGQCPSLLYTSSGVLLCAYREQTPGKPRGVGLSFSRDDGETWFETGPLYVSPDNYWDCAYPNLLELAPGEYAAFYYTAAIGTQELTRMQVPNYPRFTDADNTIEMTRFRVKS